MTAEICGNCGRGIGERETACVLDGRVVCRECHDRFRPMCPYCQARLTHGPVSQGKCPRCRGKIIVHTRQRVFPTIYLTVEQAKQAVNDE